MQGTGNAGRMQETGNVTDDRMKKNLTRVPTSKTPPNSQGNIGLRKIELGAPQLFRSRQAHTSKCSSPIPLAKPTYLSQWNANNLEKMRGASSSVVD